MAYDIKDVRTAMDPLDKQYQLVLIIILISLIIAAGISVLFTPGPEHDQKSDIFIQISQGDTGADVGKAENWIVRILWVDDKNRTYSFQDYPQESRPDPESYSIEGKPPDGSQAAMIRFLSWDGNTERTHGARYIMDQEMITSILNKYSLMASLSPVPVSTPDYVQTPVPGAPVPGMLVPESGVVCRNDDGSFTARFGYISRHDYPVSLPVGEQNRFYPGVEDRGQPVVFMPGIHHDAFTVTYPADATNQVWSLMNRQASAGTVPEVNTSITIEPVSGYAPLEVRFSQRSTGSVSDNPLSGSWNLGDGTISSAIEPFYHRYENPGTYIVSYMVQNTCNHAKDTGVVRVHRASFIWNITHGSSDVRFESTSEGEPSLWFWDFGDGYTSWDEKPVHTYQKPGIYKVGLTVSGEHGKGTAVNTITIPPQ